MAQPASNPKIEELRFRVKTDPKSRLFFPLAEELRKIDQLGEAEQVLRLGLGQHPTYLSAWVSFGRVLREENKHQEAVEALSKALQLDPGNADIAQRVALAEGRRYVSMSAFATVKIGMKEDEVRAIVGLPREDWIKQVVQNGRVYSVWIYPKSDGGASAIYFDNGVVYHTNWNAAAAPAAR